LPGSENGSKANGHLQYATGCCGDVSHIDVRHSFSQKEHTEAARIGTRLAGAVLRNWNNLTPITSNRLHATNAIVKLPLAEHPADRIELANGSVGYVPTRQAYAQGNYEVVSARCAEGSGELLVESALKQLCAHFGVQNQKASSTHP